MKMKKLVVSLVASNKREGVRKMKKNILILIALCTLSLGVVKSSMATIVFYDNFDTENGGVGALNYTGFAQWSVSSGTVDLIGNGFFDFYPGNGLYVDLDGSTNNAGVLLSNQVNLAAGLYDFSFMLGGNQRGAANDVVGVQIVMGDYSEIFNIASTQALTLYTRTVQAIMPGVLPINILFANAGGDNIGAILDEVKIETRAVPEPSTLLLLGSGLAGLGFWRRVKRLS